MTLAYSNVGFQAPANTLPPNLYAAGHNGEPVSLAGVYGAHFRVDIGIGLAAPITFTFQTAESAAGPWTNMQCQDICADAPSDVTITVTPGDADYDAVYGKICEVSMCCPSEFVRAVSSTGGRYSVTVERYNLARAPV